MCLEQLPNGIGADAATLRMKISSELRQTAGGFVCFPSVGYNLDTGVKMVVRAKDEHDGVIVHRRTHVVSTRHPQHRCCGRKGRFTLPLSSQAS